MRGTGVNPFRWLIGRECGAFWASAGRPACAQNARIQVNSGDQAGSEAKLGVGVRSSLRPVTSTV